MKFWISALFLLMPTGADAAPVAAFFAGFAGAATAATAAFPGIAAVGAWFGSSVIGSLITTLALNVGLSYLLRPDGETRAPDLDAVRLNSRSEDTPRFQAGGPVPVGGAAGSFGEFDASGNFWYIIAHCDNELTSRPVYILSGVEVEVANHAEDADLATTADITLSGEQVIDGTLTAASRVLVKDQSAPVENGVYVTGAGAWTRAPDAENAGDLSRVTVKVTGGLTQVGFWKCVQTSPEVGVDGIAFSPYTPARNEADGDVLTDDFCLDTSYDAFENQGQASKVPFFRVWTVTPDANNIYGAKPDEFTNAFPNLPEDFYLAGVCYTIVRVKAVGLEHRHKIFRWSGAMGLGEPGVVIYGNFSRMYDPRNPGHNINDRTTWTACDGNAEIVWAWWRTNPFGLNRPMSEINWDKVAEQANICDLTVTNRSGEDVPLYRCGVAGADNTTRRDIENQIKMSCDGFVAYDDEGRAYLAVGYFTEPTVIFTKQQDIYTLKTRTVDDGETAVDGVVVRYVSPLHGYTKQPCAPWFNPTYHVDGREPNLQYFDILTCQDHNQAFRLAGAIGARVAPPSSATVPVTPKGMLITSERGCVLDYDEIFTGSFEIVGKVEENNDGLGFAFTVVPLASDRWIGAGRVEGAPPQSAPSLEIDNGLEVAQNVVITVETVSTDGANAIRFVATFDSPARVDREFEFRYEVAENVYEYATVDMDSGRAYSSILTDGQDYDIQWQTKTAGGRVSGWGADIGGGESEYTLSAVANSTAPEDLVAASATFDPLSGAIQYAWTAANDPNQRLVHIYRGTSNDFGASTRIAAVYSGPNDLGSGSEGNLSAGTYFAWIVPVNGSGVEGGASATDPITVI